jgi:hypothetical protein
MRQISVTHTQKPPRAQKRDKHAGPAAHLGELALILDRDQERGSVRRLKHAVRMDGRVRWQTGAAARKTGRGVLRAHAERREACTFSTRCCAHRRTAVASLLIAGGWGLSHRMITAALTQPHTLWADPVTLVVKQRHGHPIAHPREERSLDHATLATLAPRQASTAPHQLAQRHGVETTERRTPPLPLLRGAQHGSGAMAGAQRGQDRAYLRRAGRQVGRVS